MRYVIAIVAAIVLAFVAFIIADALGLPYAVELIAALLGLAAGWFAGLELADRSGVRRR
jgi:hypothetical protein